MIRGWGLLCTDCWVGVDFGRVVIDSPGQTGWLELLHGAHADVGRDAVQALILDHAGHCLTVVDANFILQRLEHCDPDQLPYEWQYSTDNSGGINSGDWAGHSGGRRVITWLETYGPDASARREPSYRLAADYQCHALWYRRADGGLDNLSPDGLGLSESLAIG